MKWITDLRLATKLGLAFATVKLAQVNSTATQLSAHWMPAMRAIEDIKSQIARIRTRELQYIISNDPAEMEKYDKVIANDLVDLGKMQDDYVKLLLTSEEKAAYANFTSMWERYMAEDAKIRAAARTNDDETAKTLIRGESNKLIVAL